MFNIVVFFALLIQFVCSEFDPTTHPAWKLVNAENCGIRVQQRVVGGEEATIGEFPWVAQVALKIDGNPDNNITCPSAIISEQFVLSAAHCVPGPTHNYNGTVLVGEFDTKQDPDCDKNNVCAPPVKAYEVEKVILNSQDYSLVKIKEKFEFNDYVAPICLEYGELLTEDYSGLDAEFAGWGISKIDPVTSEMSAPTVMQRITLPILNKDDCRTALDFVSLGYYRNQTQIDMFICAGGRKGEHIYYGDSGGVLVLPRKVGDDIPRYFAIGVCALTSSERPRVTAVADVYARVSFYLEWMLDIMAEESGLNYVYKRHS